ncbi:MAG: hypothetical protein IT376_01635, partial [Polyangiaceae bacterium]|nr:hypothetical protein [Polyangiaceae bacterium]
MGCGLAGAVALSTGSASAGRGWMYQEAATGQKVLSLYASLQFRREELQDADFVKLREQVSRASVILCDATEGQIRIGRVVISYGPYEFLGTQAENVDLRVYEGSAGARAGTHGSPGLGYDVDWGTNAFGTTLPLNSYVGLPSGAYDGMTIAHELGHYVLGLGEQYPEAPRLQFGCEIGA